MTAGEVFPDSGKPESGKEDRRYTAADLARLCAVSAASVRSWIARGLLSTPRARSVPHFGFRELARCRTLARLLRAGWTAPRIAKAVAAARAVLPDIDAALAGIDADAGIGMVAVRLPDGRLCTEGGQGLLDLGLGDRVPAANVRGMRSTAEWFQQGVEFEAAGRFEEAARAYERSLPAGGAEAQFNLGNCRYQLRDFAGAEAAYADAVHLQPDYAEAWNNLGIARVAQLARRGEAVLAFRRALELRPHYADAHYNLADALAAIGDLEGARQHWRAYLNFDPNSRFAELVRRRLQSSGGAG